MLHLLYLKCSQGMHFHKCFLNVFFVTVAFMLILDVIFMKQGNQYIEMVKVKFRFKIDLHRPANMHNCYIM